MLRIPPFRVPFPSGFEDVSDYSFGTTGDPEGYQWSLLPEETNGDDAESLEDLARRCADAVDDPTAESRSDGPVELEGVTARCIRLHFRTGERPFVWELIEVRLAGGRSFRTAEEMDLDAEDRWRERLVERAFRGVDSEDEGWSLDGIGFDIPPTWRPPAALSLVDARDLSVTLMVVSGGPPPRSAQSLQQRWGVAETSRDEAEQFERSGGVMLDEDDREYSLAVDAFVRRDEPNERYLIGYVTGPLREESAIRSLSRELAAGSVSEGALES